MTATRRPGVFLNKARRTGGWRGTAFGIVLIAVCTGIVLARPLLRPVPVGPDSARPLSRPTISVVTDRTTVAINPLVYGLGAGVSTSTYEPPIAQWAARLAKTLRQGGVTALRFGADHADDFDWEHSRLYPLHGAPERVGTGKSAYSGIKAFLAFTRHNHLEPMIVVNAEIDDPQQAARLVAYTQDHGTPVTYWEIGNEPYQWTHFGLELQQRQPGDQQKASPDDYAAIVVAYARAMQAAAARLPSCLHRASPCLRIIADEWITNATDQSWTTSVDLIDTHYYSFFGPSIPPSDADVAAGAFAAPALPRLSLTSWLTDLTTTMRGFSGSEDLQVIVGSWGLDPGYPPPGNHYLDFGQALFTAEMLGQMIGQGVQVASAYPFYGAGNDQAAIDYTGVPRAGLHVLTLFTKHFGRWYLDGSAGGVAGSPLWSVAATTARQGGDLTLVVVNSAPRRAVDATIMLSSGHGGPASQSTWRPDAEVWTLLHDQQDGSPFYGTTGLHYAQRPLTLTHGSFRYTFPAYSVTLLRLHRR